MSHADSPARKLSTATKLFYGVGDIGNAISNSAVQFFLMIFYTDAALLSPALVGSALLIGKLWDAINDPLAGWLTDRAKPTRLGKRRTFMIVGAVPLGLAFALLWRVPGGLPPAAVFAWVVLTFAVYDTIWTLTNVPYYALTTELTDDYDERAGLTATRMSLAVPAYLVGAALTPVLVALFATKRAGYGAIGIVYGVGAAAALLISAAGLRERPAIAASRAETPPLQALRLTLANQAFVRLLLAYFFLNAAFALIKTLMAYYLTYQLGMEAQVPLVMGLMLVFVVLALFPWKWLSDRWDKGPAYALGMGIGALAVAVTFFLPQGPTPWVYVVSAVAGIGFSAQWVFPWSMVPDVVDQDRLVTGEYRSGMYFGVWGLATKISEALAIAATGWLLALFRYAPNVAQSVGTLTGIRAFFGPVPAVLILICLPFLIWYPITRSTHRQVLARLEEDEPCVR